MSNADRSGREMQPPRSDDLPSWSREELPLHVPDRPDAQANGEVHQQHDYESPRRYRMPGYVRPGGWYPHRWRCGEILPPDFRTREYRLPQFWRYELATPPIGYVWVRYGDDVLLVQRASGLVLRAIYDIFR